MRRGRDDARMGRKEMGRKDRPQSPRAAARDTRKLLRVATLPAVLAVHATAPERIEQLYFEEALKTSLGELCITLAKAHRPYRVTDARELERPSGTPMHGGVLALARPRLVPILDTADAKLWAQDGHLLPILDGIGNPHNLGAIARTAAFFGVPRLIFSNHPGQALPSDASYRVARGGLDYLALYQAHRLPEALKRLRRDYLIVGTTLERGQPAASIGRAGRPVALVLGNEEEGLPAATLEACEAIVTIPGGGQVQSLNVAASAAILIHELQRKGGAATG